MGPAGTLPRPRLLLAVAASLALVSGIVGLGLLTWYDHDDTLADWKADLGLSARMMEAHITSLHGTADANLARIADHIGSRPLASLRNSEGDRVWLEKMRDGIPYAFAICLHDAKADLILSTDRQDLFAPSALGRDDITQAAAQPGKTVISAMISTKVTPGHFVVLSHAIRDPDGTIAGFAEILVTATYFDDYYRSPDGDPTAIYGIYRRDGSLVARHPMPDGPLIKLDLDKHPFTEFTRTKAGTFRATSVVDGVERMVAYRWLHDLDLVVISGLTMDRVFRDWTARTQRNATLFAGSMLLLLLAAMVIGESLRQETRLLRSVEAKAAELTEALAEKDVLFQEVHHRVKNNLQVISSLLTMQSLHVTDEATRGTLKDALDRIHSMGLVHQTLYESNTAARVDLGTYFGKLAEGLAGSYATSRGAVTVQVEVTGTLDLDSAVPLGMLANEALANALKHAFADGRPGTVTVSLVREADQWCFTVKDDGCGLPEKPGKGIGLGLIRALARQLGGRSAITRDGGTLVTVTFPAKGAT